VTFTPGSNRSEVLLAVPVLPDTLSRRVRNMRVVAPAGT
jgi:hypothetical protein